MSALPEKIAVLRVERRVLADLRPHPRNPRTHPEPGTPQWEALKRSLELDYFDPLVVNELNGMLVSGHYLVWTDPPYNVDYQGRQVRNAFAGAGWRESQCLVWIKSGFVLGRQDYHWQHEPILYGWKPGAGHYWQGGFCQATVIDDEPAKLGKLSKDELVSIIQALRNDRDSTVVREARGQVGELHPTVKPLGLVARQIWNSSQRGQTVLELCGGSGTTIMAAEQTQRIAVASELDPKFCAVILERATVGGLRVERIVDVIDARNLKTSTRTSRLQRHRSSAAGRRRSSRLGRTGSTCTERKRVRRSRGVGSRR